MQLRNERGITLVEVLATLVIIAIILVIVTSIIGTSQKQGIEQKKDTQMLNDEKYALKVITKDIRRSLSIENGLELHINGEKVYYYEQNKQLIKEVNGVKQPIIDTIGCFKMTENDQKINISISANPVVINCDQSLPTIQKTTIQLRKGDG